MLVIVLSGTYHSATATGNPDEPPLTFSLLFNGMIRSTPAKV